MREIGSSLGRTNGNLIDNVRRLYVSCRQRKDMWTRTLRNSVNRELKWSEELKQYGVEQQPSLAAMLAPAMCAHFVPEPPIAEDTMIWLAEQLTSEFHFFVPPWNDFRFVIPPGFGAIPGLYETERGTVAWQVDDRQALLNEVREFLKFYPHVAIQTLGCEYIPENSPIYDRIGPVVNHEETPEIVKVFISGVLWDEEWSETGKRKPCSKRKTVSLVS